MRVVFLFPGHGSQYPGMGFELFESDRVFRDAMLSLDRTVTEVLGRSLVESLYASTRGREALVNVPLGQSVTFCVQYAVALSLMDRGVTPDAALAMSLGEFAAAAAFGMLSPDEALRLVIAQAGAVERLCAPGGMVAVFADAAALTRQGLPRGLELACRNGTGHFIVSGRERDLAAYVAVLREAGIVCHSLPVQRGFHSAAIDEARGACLEQLRARRFRPASVPIISSVDAIANRVRAPEHFWSAIRGPMLFDEASRSAGAGEGAMLVDVGPGSIAGWLRQRGYSNVHTITRMGGGDLARLQAVVDTARSGHAG